MINLVGSYARVSLTLINTRWGQAGQTPVFPRNLVFLYLFKTIDTNYNPNKATITANLEADLYF